MILASHGLIASQIASFDADAVAFFGRVTTAGGSLSATEKAAVNTLVVDMKAAGIWSGMKAIYPMVGASAAACAQNLKSSSFTGTFTSGWTFASTGVTPNGTSAYMDTGLNPTTTLSTNSVCLSYYSRSTIKGDIQMGGNDTNYLTQIMSSAILMISQLNSASSDFLPMPITSYQGLFTTVRSSSTIVKGYKNGALVITDSKSSTGTPNLNLYLGARNNGGTAGGFDSKQCAFASFANGLTDTQASNFYTAVQAFQTTLSRQV